MHIPSNQAGPYNIGEPMRASNNPSNWEISLLRGDEPAPQWIRISNEGQLYIPEGLNGPVNPFGEGIVISVRAQNDAGWGPWLEVAVWSDPPDMGDFDVRPALATIERVLEEIGENTELLADIVERAFHSNDDPFAAVHGYIDTEIVMALVFGLPLSQVPSMLHSDLGFRLPTATTEGRFQMTLLLIPRVMIGEPFPPENPTILAVIEIDFIIPMVASIPDVLLGDVDGNGVVDDRDVLLLRLFIAGHDVDINLVAADVNGDGNITDVDVLLIRLYLAGQIETLG